MGKYTAHFVTALDLAFHALDGICAVELRAVFFRECQLGQLIGFGFIHKAREFGRL